MNKFLHTRIRVSDLDRSIKWYCDLLGFRVFQHMAKSPAGNEIVHLELPGNEHMLELTYSADYKLSVPEDLMHICIGVDDISAFCEGLEKQGLEIWPDGWRHVFGGGGMKMAFISDPDGYDVEIMEN